MNFADMFMPMARWSAPQILCIDGRHYTVELPVIRDVVELAAALPGFVAGEQDDAALVDAVLERWLDPELHSALRDMDADAVLAFAAVMCRAGTEELPTPRIQENGHETPLDPFLLLSDYQDVYGGEVSQIYLSTPWSFFIHGLARIDAANARALLRIVEIEILPHSGKAARGTLNSLTRRARGIATTGDTELYAPPDIIQRDRARLREMLGGMPAEEE